MRLVVISGFINIYSIEYDKPSELLFPEEDLFWAQKEEVSVTAGARINDGGKIPGKIVSVTAVDQRKTKGNLQSNLRHPSALAVFPKLAVDRDLTAGGNRVQERFAVACKIYD